MTPDNKVRAIGEMYEKNLITRAEARKILANLAPFFALVLR